MFSQITFFVWPSSTIHIQSVPWRAYIHWALRCASRLRMRSWLDFGSASQHHHHTRRRVEKPPRWTCFRISSAVCMCACTCNHFFSSHSASYRFCWRASDSIRITWSAAIAGWQNDTSFTLFRPSVDNEVFRWDSGVGNYLSCECIAKWSCRIDDDGIPSCCWLIRIRNCYLGVSLVQSQLANWFNFKELIYRFLVILTINRGQPTWVHCIDWIG